MSEKLFWSIYNDLGESPLADDDVPGVAALLVIAYRLEALEALLNAFIRLRFERKPDPGSR